MKDNICDLRTYQLLTAMPSGVSMYVCIVYTIYIKFLALSFKDKNVRFE